MIRNSNYGYSNSMFVACLQITEELELFFITRKTHYTGRITQYISLITT